MPDSFVDSNVLLYLASADLEKSERAERILAEGGVISVQVLNECASVLRRKMRMDWPDAHAFLAAIRALLEVHALTVETHDSALAVAERHRLSIYDATIVASALAAGCTTLWSEDMQHGMRIGRLRIANPFRTE